MPHAHDWQDAPDVSVFYGRTAELATLKQWVLQDRCRFIGLFGMGGIGKTSLAVKLAKELQDKFDRIIWRSLRHAPPLQDLLADLIQALCDRQETNLPDTLEGRILRLLEEMRHQRCAIVLDNGETLMQPGEYGGRYRAGYEDYSRLLQCIGETSHQSTLILTSREQPKSIAAIGGETLPVRSLKLTGLPLSAGRELFRLKGEFSGSPDEWKLLIEHYAGNPLALKMVAGAIQDCFDGKLSDFLEVLQQGTSVFGDIRDLLASQINRLSDLEQQVMYWLALNREPISLSELRADFVPQVPLGYLLEALTSLQRRSLVEKRRTQFTLQPGVMEYLTECAIARICEEIENGKISLLRTHALLKAQAKDYIRDIQTRLILKPIVEQLLATYSRENLEVRFQQILSQLQGKSCRETGYVAGNLLNLACQFTSDLEGWDFSNLSVWQADLSSINLRHVNFSRANLAKSIFKETFSQILSIAFSPDGKLLATGDVNHEIHIWQVADGKKLFTCRIDEGWIWSVAFSPDGRYLASSANRTVKLWDVQTGECLQTFNDYPDRVFSLAFSPDGYLLASGSEDRLIRVWDLRTGQLQLTLSGHTDEVRSVTFAPQRYANCPDGHLLASGSYDGTVRLWDISQGTCSRVLAGHADWVWSVAFSPDGSRLASGSSDRTVKLWDVSSGKLLESLLGHARQIRTVAFSPDGKTLASGSDDRSIRLWNHQTGEGLRVLQGHQSWITSVVFSPDANLLASGGEDQSVRLWEMPSYRCLRTLQGHSNGVWSVAFNPQGTTLASGHQDGIIRLWESQTGKHLGGLAGHSSWVWSVAFSPDGQLLASGSEDRTVRLWNTRTGQLLNVLRGHTDAVFSVLFSPDGQTLFSGSLDGTIKGWNVRLGQCDRALRGHQGGIWSLALSQDGRLLASSSQDQTIRLWDVATGRCQNVLSGHQSWIRACAISPDCQTLVSGSADGMIKLWQVNTGKCLQTLFAHRGPVLSVVFTPEGREFASSGADAAVKIWDVAQLECRRLLQGHEKWVRFLAYSPDGGVLASCSQDETIKLWDIRRADSSVTLRVPRPYEGMDVTDVTGLTEAQISMLQRLGAIANL
jgi:WD40 repeat protein